MRARGGARFFSLSNRWTHRSDLGKGCFFCPGSRSLSWVKMARPGSVRHKVLSSGRLTGSVKLTSGKKQSTLRKVARSDVDSGYSLYSTDSEDQVATIHHGLDRCASLLKDILQNESEGMETDCQKTGKTAFVRTASRPLFSKVSGSKKRAPKKKSLSAVMQKEMVPMPNRKPASVNAAVTEKDTTPVSTGQPIPVQPIHAPCTQHSPVMHQKLCEHVQTQMSLLNIQPLQKSNGIHEVPLSIIPVHTYQPVTAFNSRLPTSTPALSPQYAANPAVVQPGALVDNCSQCASQMGPLLPTASSGSTATAQVQPVASCSALPHMIQSAPNNPTPSGVLAPPRSKEAVPDQGNHEQQLKEADLIRCLQAHLALLQAHEKENGKAKEKTQDANTIQSKSLSSKEEETAEEHSEGTLSEEENLDDIDIAPVKDISCQTSFDKEGLKPKKTSLQKTAQKVKTVKYLLGELKALLTDHEDSEILRLLGEVEDTVSLLPAVVGNTHVQAEIALAVQPLRSENAQLRRRLRILNQQLKNQERAEKECSMDSNCEFFSLQSLNMTLQSQLNESIKSNELLQNKNEEFIQMLQSQKEENKRLSRIMYEREQEQRQQYDIDSTKLKIEADEMLTNMKSLQYKLEAVERENQILGITLRQRDAEVNRLRELARALQGSMSKLLSDLTVDTTKPKQEISLSKALLEIHEKRLQPDTYPLSDTIMSYLKKLETNPLLINAEPLLPKGEIKEPNQGYDMKAAEQSPQKSPVAAEAIVAPKNFTTFLKPDIEAASSSSTLVEGHEPDETIYIPLSSSPSQKPAAATERTETQYKVPKKLDCDFGLANSKQLSRYGMLGNVKVFDKLYGSFNPKKTVENKSESMGKIAKLEGERLQMQPKEIANEAPQMILDVPDRLQPDKFFFAPISYQKGNTQKKGTGISVPDSSFSTFDWMSGKSEWTISSFSTFTSRDEEDFKNGLATLDANIARLQKTLQNSLKKTVSP
ncbi:coiled-coil domain-containing protein 14 isoform X2 [Rhineura floridana]|uniref:coiled-coil domain-containing protein 14 isoform X2 n=1 Tax=Rhineura floridana TaxID=261503 RepID=UPI002AC810CE|nr:coiled-coil domain-containing protein 14 isoform X2 [Rhineura floridana]